MPIATSIPQMDRMLGAELTRNRQAHNQRTIEDAARYNVLKSAIISGDADAINELSDSRGNFDAIVDQYGKKLIRSYYAHRLQS